MLPLEPWGGLSPAGAISLTISPIHVTKSINAYFPRMNLLETTTIKR